MSAETVTTGATGVLYSWLPLAPILTPLGLGLLLLSPWRRPLKVALLMGGTLLTLLFSLLLLIATSDGSVLVSALGGWAAPFGIVMTADRLGAYMSVLGAVSGVFAAWFMAADEDRVRERHHAFALLLLLLTGVQLSFLTGDLFNLFVAFEVMLVASYALAVLGSTREQLREGFRYIVMNLVASALLVSLPLLRDLVVGAIIPGVGTVLSFLPTLLVLYLAMSFLEDSGYMARAAFLMDRLMRSLGLDGRAFIPLILGFGCNVPAVSATRTLERRSDRVLVSSDRVLVSMIIPFMSCSARLPVYVIFAAALFPRSGSWIVWSMYLLGMLMAFLFAWLLRRTALPAEGGGVLLELPPYRFPAWAVLWKHAWRRTKSFARRARTTVLATVAVVWLLLALPAVSGGKFAQVDPKDSVFGSVAQAVSPLFAPLGFGNWQATGALVPGFIAKEVVVGTLGQIYLGEQAAAPAPLGFIEGTKQAVTATWKAVTTSVAAIPTIFALPQLGTDTSTDQKSPLAAALARAFTPASGLAYLVFVLLYTPCIVTVGAIAQEHGRRVAWITVAYQLVAAWVVAFLVYQVAGRLGL